MEDFDNLWNYADLPATEAKFREALEASEGKSVSYVLQLKTQIARTYSLRAKFDEAHQLLDEVEKQLDQFPDLAHVRYHLERGRTFNSSGKKDGAKIHFEKALQISEELKDDFYAVDAIHMLAIVASPLEAIRLNKDAIIMVENSKDQRTKRWLGSLYNNLAWGYFDHGEYEKALSVFLRALQWRENTKVAREIFIAKWCIARTLRALNRIDDALKVQLALFEEATTTGHPDGYVHEELGELFLLKNDRLKYPFHFEKAYEMLLTDRFMPPGRLERIKSMAGL